MTAIGKTHNPFEILAVCGETRCNFCGACMCQTCLNARDGKSCFCQYSPLETITLAEVKRLKALFDEENAAHCETLRRLGEAEKIITRLYRVIDKLLER